MRSPFPFSKTNTELSYIHSTLDETSRIALCLFLTFGLEAKSPHPLFIAIDDLNDWVGCMVSPKLRRQY